MFVFNLLPIYFATRAPSTHFRQLQVITEAMQVLRGCEYGRGSMAAALHGLRPQFVEEGPRKSLDAMTEWMVSSVDD